MDPILRIFFFLLLNLEKEILLNRSKFIYKYPFAQFKIFLKINFDKIHMEYIYVHIHLYNTISLIFPRSLPLYVNSLCNIKVQN